MKLSKNFDNKEFACPCCGKKDISIKLITKLQQLRDKLDKPIYITSGVRCEAYNKKVGGNKYSPHLKGLAADIQVKGLPSFALAYNAESIENMRLGIYPNHVHIDIIPANPSKFWLSKKYGDRPIYSKQERDLKEFLKNNL